MSLTPEQVEQVNAELEILNDRIEEVVEYLEDLDKRNKTLPALRCYVEQMQEHTGAGIEHDILKHGIPFEASAPNRVYNSYVEVFMVGYFLGKVKYDLMEMDVENEADPSLRDFN